MAKSFRDVHGDEVTFMQGPDTCWIDSRGRRHYPIVLSGIIQLDRNGACDLRDLLNEFILPEDENFALADAPAAKVAQVTPPPVVPARLSNVVLARLSNVDLRLDANNFLRFTGEFRTESRRVYSLGREADIALIRGLLGVFRVKRLSEIEGKPCWLTLMDHRIVLIEPLFPSDGTPFEVAGWETEGSR